MTVMNRTSPAPPHLLPMLATSSPPFDDPACRFEVKWDGVRCLAAVSGDSWRLWGRGGTVYTEHYPELGVLRRLPNGTVLDGELVLVRDGRADFHALMNRHRRTPRMVPFLAESVRYVVFDVLYYRGRCLIQLPFEERHNLLHARLPEVPGVEFCHGIIGDGRAYFQKAIAAGHEGVVAKRLTSRYTPSRRTGSWLKIKQTADLPCVVIGYRAGVDGLRDLLMAALVDGTLSYVGIVELGLNGKAELLRRLQRLGRERPVVRCRLSANWVNPELFGIVRHCGWRPGGGWRDAVLLRGLDYGQQGAPVVASKGDL
jgi:bifunctional non-homologous end joining protein LigD